MKKNGLFSRLFMGLVFLFLYAPIFVLIVFSFNQSKSRGAWTGFTFGWYEKLFHNQMIIQWLMNTLLVAVISSVVATVLGTLAAIGTVAELKKQTGENNLEDAFVKLVGGNNELA